MSINWAGQAMSSVADGYGRNSSGSPGPGHPGNARRIEGVDTSVEASATREVMNRELASGRPAFQADSVISSQSG